MTRYRVLNARIPDTCRGCERTTNPGEAIRYGGPGLVYCADCEPDPDATPTSTTRERREARAERLRDWAGSHQAKSTAALDRAQTMGEAIPFGQPVLVGHYSEGRDRRYRARIGDLMDRGVADYRKANDMNRRADNIEAGDHAIYSDDPDAVERLEAKLAGLEAQRARITAYNASCRKGARDVTLLDEHQQASLVSLARVAAYQIRANGAAPAYWASNLSGQISTVRKRLERLR